MAMQTQAIATLSMPINAEDLCRLASELANEHGAEALHFARRAVITFEAEGAPDRASLWFALSVLLDDIVSRRLDPDRPLSIH
jgi:hypothetical protein